MSTNSPTIKHFTLLALTVAMSTLGASNRSGAATAADDQQAIRPFHVNFPEEQLIDLRKRVAATRWPDKETVTDQSQGVQLVTVQKLARYWETDYDWRKCEAKLNALPNFITAIDGVDIHFIHVRSKHPNALPIIITHGWPGSIIEQLKLIGPSPILRLMMGAPRTLSMSSSPRCRATGFLENRRRPAGIPSASHVLG